MTEKRKPRGSQAKIDGIPVEDDKPLELPELPKAGRQFTARGRKAKRR